MYTCMLLQVTTSYKSCSTFLADNWFSFSMFLRMTLELIVPWNSYLALLAVEWLFTIMWLHMYRQVTPLDTSYPTLSWVCVAIRGFQWLPAPHCLQLTIFFSPVCILLCCFRVPLLTNPLDYRVLLVINLKHKQPLLVNIGPDVPLLAHPLWLSWSPLLCTSPHF